MELVFLRRMCFKYKTGAKHENTFINKRYHKADKNVISIIQIPTACKEMKINVKS